MSNAIPPEMLEAATAAMLKAQEYGTGESPTVYTREAFQAANMAATWRLTERYAQAALEAAGVPALMAELQQRELTEKIIRKLKAEYDKQANYPHEEGETWSYSSMSRYKAQLDLLFEMGHLAHDPDIISRLLYEDSQFLDRWLDSAEAKHHDAYSFLQSLGVVATTDRSRGDEGVACGTHRRA